MLREGEAFEGEGSLRVLGLIDGYKVIAESVDGIAVFDLFVRNGIHLRPV